MLELHKSKKLKRIVTMIATVVLMVATASRVEAAFFDRDKLAHALATRFNLNEKEVSEFLANFQYHPDDYSTNSSPKTNQTPVATAQPTPTPASYTSNGVVYQYDDGTDQYYKASEIVDVQHKTNLDFIENKLDSQVKLGKLTLANEHKILAKLAELMDKSPSSKEFAQMSVRDQQVAIAQFKTEMDGWMRGIGMNMAQLRDMTGKGNKYLMGIYLD